MKVKEYLQLIGKTENSSDSLTFVISRAVKDDNTPYYHEEYRTTPIRSIWEWCESDIMNYIVLNPTQPPIDWLTTGWNNRYKRGDLMSMLVIPKEDLYLIYPQKQADELIIFIDKKIKESIKAK